MMEKKKPWRMLCPTGGEYEGDCRYRKLPNGTFILECPDGVKTIKPCKPQKKESIEAGESIAERRRKFLEEVTADNKNEDWW